MFLFKIALAIASIAVIIVLISRFFWLAGLILIFRAVNLILTYELISNVFGIESRVYYFIFLMVVVVSINFFVVWLTRNTLIIRYFVFLFILTAILWFFDLREIFTLADWLDGQGVEFSAEYAKNKFIELATTPVDEYAETAIEFGKGLADSLKKVYDTIFG